MLWIDSEKKKKAKLNRYIRIWGIILIVGVASNLTGIHIFQSYRDFNERFALMRKNYIITQKDIIRQEVERVAQLIR